MTADSVRLQHGRHPFLESPSFRPLDDAHAAAFDQFIARAIAEDVGRDDATTIALIPEAAHWTGSIIARAPGTIAGLPVAARVFHLVDPRIEVTKLVDDGTQIAAGTVLATLRGPARGMLTAERVALNLLGRLCGVATLTRRFVDAVGAAHARITDTRKTTPGLRDLERYAVRAGGGVNHRLTLGSAILIKDNHLAAVGSVGEAVRRARAYAAADVVVEVECDDLAQVREALDAGADSVLLDNMDDATMRTAVAVCRGRALVEASGGMTLERIAEVASTGVDIISVGALTHSAPALDVALDFSRDSQKDDV